MSTLYVVSTPIGNLEDITFRALRILKEVDLIVCEDTRQTLKLLNHYNISKPLVSYFQHSKLSKIDYIAGQLEQGKKVALVTDAGTPGISDPGGKLLTRALAKGGKEPNGSLTTRALAKGGKEPNGSLTNEIATRPGLAAEIVPIPGPSALTAAASVSGFPMDKFLFLGFPPAKRKRKKFFGEVINSKYPVIFYEAPHRISKTLKELQLTINNKQLTINIVVCRELTKKFETIYRGTAEEIIKILENDKNNLKGEFVIIVSNE